MSKGKLIDAALVRRMLDDSVRWFHESRLHSENEGRELLELSRECANGSFQRHAWMIPEARREIVARKFMDACAERFNFEVLKALAEIKEPEYVA